LVNLVDLDRVRHLNCGAAAYATLIDGTQSIIWKTNITQGDKSSSLPLGGMWRVIEIIIPPLF